MQVAGLVIGLPFPRSIRQSYTPLYSLLLLSLCRFCLFRLGFCILGLWFRVFGQACDTEIASEHSLQSSSEQRMSVRWHKTLSFSDNLNINQ